MKDFKLVAGMILGILVIIGSIAYSISPAYSIDMDNYITVTHTVKGGETLWGLGKQYCAEDDDIRVWIDAVKKLNGCQSAIYAGQSLELYVAK